MPKGLLAQDTKGRETISSPRLAPKAKNVSGVPEGGRFQGQMPRLSYATAILSIAFTNEAVRRSTGSGSLR